MRWWSRSHKKNANGFTLIEAVIFILIGGVMTPIILVGLGSAVRRGTESLVTYRYAATADAIMRQEMEKLIGLTYSDSSLGIVNEESLDIDEKDFSGTCTIEYVDENLDPTGMDVGYKQISISVTTPDETEYELCAIVTSWE